MNSELNKCQKHYHVKKNDKVQVISGGWKNKTAKVVAILKKKDRVVLEMQNLSDAAHRPQERRESERRSRRPRRLRARLQRQEDRFRRRRREEGRVSGGTEQCPI